ncbi:ABC-type multidrug transport system permease component [Methanonatronarchaeum thermophilum]|uniref:ABC-type multidrug transport system permease component n=1 Tax=Methanonatronarchaeum thermophilum TaxID=1927129 RepID=A0A1Y3GIQ0_9EURY|nr:DUF373 family protein [Methanonatronarchaeum thermophilum]OUJ19276.1 ABC-type multidrug transport system permease component [Methanonatronarchaeum thermophilum]
MKTLILCIDRDNDIGLKAGVDGPIVGEEANLEAAQKLAINDPEDSDINSVYAGVKTARDLKKQGEDVVLATVTGSENLGIESDNEVARQLDEILENHPIERAIVITDGAEDENVMPIVESRVKVNSVKRVVVKQSQNLETTYYLLKRFMEDPRFMQTFFIPIGLALVAYSIFTFLGHSELAISGIFIVLGLYMIFKAIGGEEYIYRIAYELKESLLSGNISFVTYTASFIILLIGGMQAYLTYLEIEQTSNLVMTAHILTSSIWWIIAAAIMGLLGKLFDSYIKKSKHVWRYTVLPFLTIATGLIIWGGSAYVLSISEGATTTAYQVLAFSIIGGLTIAFLGIMVVRYAKKIKQSLKMET